MSFIKDQIKNKTDLPVANEYKRLQKKEMLDDAASWDWSSRGFKLYPSGLKFSMCPRDHIRSRAVYSGIQDEDSKERVEFGKAIHAMIQNTLKNSPRIAFKTMGLPHPDTAIELATKLQNEWPECPIRDLGTHISGKADLPPWRLDKDRLAVIDIKTTSKDDRGWEAIKSIPLNYKTQLSVYGYLWNRDGYWAEKINTLGVIYWNASKPIIQMSKFKELYIPFTDDLQQKTKDLLYHLELEMCYYLAGAAEIDCTYPHCYYHGRGRELESE